MQCKQEEEQYKFVCAFQGLRLKVDLNSPGSLELQIAMKYDNFWNDGKLKEEMKKMMASKFKDKLRSSDDMELSDLLRGERRRSNKRQQRRRKDSRSILCIE